MASVLGVEIHHIGISGGDSTVVIVRYRDADDATLPVKVYKLLIDAGGESYDAGQRYLQAYLARNVVGDPATPFDLAVASHYHADHIAGFQACGIEFISILDIGGYPVGNDVWEPVNPLGNLAGDSAVLQGYGLQVTREFDKGGRTRVELPFAKKSNFTSGTLGNAYRGPVTVNLTPGGEVKLTCYCGGGVLADGTNALRANAQQRVLVRNGYRANGSNLPKSKRQWLSRMTDDELNKVSPNDLSLAFLLEWGAFRYFTAGDLSGDLSLTRYANIEEPLVKYLRTSGVLANPVTVMKATHHGSNHNNYAASIRRKADYSLSAATEDQEAEGASTVAEQVFEAENKIGLLDELKPESIVVCCNQMKGVPGNEFIQRATTYCGTKQNNRTLTINFVNDCTYAHPNYGSKQKARKSDLDALRNTVSNTYLTPRSGVTSNGNPQVLVVHVPALAASVQPRRGTRLIRKATHTLKLDLSQPQLLTNRPLVSLNTGQQLQNLAADVRAVLYDEAGKRAKEVVDLFEDEKSAYLRKRYPSLVNVANGVVTLRYTDQAATEKAIRALYDRCYPWPDSGGAWPPDETGTSPYERLTVYWLQANTPDTGTVNRSVVGNIGFDKEMVDYWKANRQYARSLGLVLEPVKRQKSN